MLFKKKNGQVSIEILAILGVLIIGSIILASFYISNINKKTDQITKLDKSSDNFNSWLNDSGGNGIGTNGTDTCGDGVIDNGEACDGTNFGGATCSSETSGAKPNGSLVCSSDCKTILTTNCTAVDTCGNGVIDSGEQCDGGNLGGATCETVVGTGSTGNLSCASDCTYDTSDCSPPSGSTGFSFDINPYSDNGYVSTDYNGMDFNLQLTTSSYVDVNVTVTNQATHLLSSNCSIDGNPITDSSGYKFPRFINSKEYYPKIDCNDTGTYTFKFTATDDVNIVTRNFTFTTTILPGTGAGAYALCSTSSNENGTLSFCVNNFTATTTNGSGTLQIFVNQPDNKEATGSSCNSNNNGSLCISVGNT